MVNEIEAGMKRCPGCGEEFPITLEFFHKNNRTLSGFQCYCKGCHRKQTNKSRKIYYATNRLKIVKEAKERYFRNIERIKKVAKTRWQRIRLEVLTHYSSSPPKCACCKIETLEFLAIDHMHGGGKQHRIKIKKTGCKFYKWLIDNDYPEGYRVLCHNCNCARGFYGYCPHERMKNA